VVMMVTARFLDTLYVAILFAILFRRVFEDIPTVINPYYVDAHEHLPPCQGVSFAFFVLFWVLISIDLPSMD